MKYLIKFNESEHRPVDEIPKFIPLDIVEDSIDISLDLEDEGVDYVLQFYVKTGWNSQWRGYGYILELPNQEEVLKTTQSIGVHITPPFKDLKKSPVNKEIIRKSVKRYIDFAEANGLEYNIHLSPSNNVTNGRVEFRKEDEWLGLDWIDGDICNSAKIEICIFPK